MTSHCILAVLSISLLQAGGSVVFASHRLCPQTPFRLIGHDELELLGRCDASRRVLHLSIRNRAVASAGPLRAFTIAFCEHSVTGVETPKGWASSLGTGEPRQTVEWSINPGIEPGEQVEGFAVMLNPGWVMSQDLTINWAETSGGQLTVHDCP